MKEAKFKKTLKLLIAEHEELIKRKNEIQRSGPRIFVRYKYPVLTAAHAPLHWRYDFNYESNPYCMERMGINSAFNAGAIEFDGKMCVMARVEGYDRKSFFALAESKNGVDRFRFWDEPIEIPEIDERETNTYDMRLVQHEDGWIYGMFCSERHHETQPGNLSAAIASCGLARTKDLKNWERLPNLKTEADQQRNVVLHPEFIDGKYAFYTRPLRDFAATGSGEGVGWGLCDSMGNPVIENETIFHGGAYHTIKEGKNGQGPAPIKTPEGWLHLMHGVRDTAAGMRYVLYLLLTDLNDPTKVLKEPGGYLLAPEGEERVGDVSNVAFSNGWIARENGEVFMYYGSSDTRLHVAVSTVDRLLDYSFNTPEDGLRTFVCVQQRKRLIESNRKIMKELGL
ncbi:MAG: glycosidase [Candidatus Hinthialibacter antarcticus]|nr:glycosidase [Candidatus Hinthialibacter antarcticus]